jgi:DNA-binding response OmpR family regulator
MQHLNQHEGEVVKRITLLEEVWGYDRFSGSNVVDSKIRSIRKKLGDYAPMIETVSGIGYRFKRI